MQYLVEKIVAWLIKSEAILKEDREIYEYAMYAFIISMSPVIVVVIIGEIMGKLAESILIIIPFMFIRKFSGGFHAKYAWVCMVFSSGILFACVYMVVHITYNVCCINVILICSAISLMIFSPIDSEKRRLDLSEKKEYKITAIILVTIFVIIYYILMFADREIYAICIAEGIILTAGLQIPCILEKIAIGKNKMMIQKTK